MVPPSESVTEDEFSALFMALARDVVDAHIFWGQAKALEAQMELWPEVQAEAWSFWAFALEAHQRTALSCLCRVFDQERTSLHLRSLLMLTRDHLNYFGKEAQMHRRPNDPFAQWLPDDAVAPEPEQISKDIELCEQKDPDVSALLRLRHNFVAHRSKKLSMRSSQSKIVLLPYEQIERLLARASALLNRYSYLRDASIFGMTPLGHDAVETIFRSMQRDLDSQREQQDKQLAAWNAKRKEFESLIQGINANAHGREDEARAECKALAESYGYSINAMGEITGVFALLEQSQPLANRKKG